MSNKKNDKVIISQTSIPIPIAGIYDPESGDVDDESDKNRLKDTAKKEKDKVVISSGSFPVPIAGIYDPESGDVDDESNKNK